MYFHRLEETNGSPAMTASGLLGLAVGHGVASGVQRGGGERRQIDDPDVRRGLEYLASQIGLPRGPDASRPRGSTQEIDLYFLWSLERVGVLYNTKRIGDRDWYAWGAELLVDHQNADGSWFTRHYNGSSPLFDTSFALLFLQRVNLVQDLSSKLDFVIKAKGAAP